MITPSTITRRSLALFIALALIMTAFRPGHAQDTPAPSVTSPTDVIDQIMGLIGRGRIDEAMALMEGFKNQPDLREEARGRLARLPNEQGAYRGYDVAAIQRFTGQFQTFDVLAYYDEQPVLLRFHFYRPQIADAVKWTVLGFQVTTELREITEVLKDTPADYVGRAKH